MIAWMVLIVSALIVFYILFGYPLLLALLPPSPGPAIRKNPTYTPAVSVILAVHNGAEFLAAKLESILALEYPRDLLEVLVVSDGSTDATDAVAGAAQGVRLFKQEHRGKAAAVNLAIAEARGEILFFTDVRQPLDPSSLRHLTANFSDPTVGAVTGEMKLRKPDGGGEQADMDLYWRYELWARRQQSSRDSIFNTTGCIYAMRRSLAEPLREETLSDDAMLPLGAFFKGYRVVFDPEAVAWDQPAVSGTEFRRRWRNLAGLWQVHLWRPELFTSANRMRWHFLSHKFARLVLPWALLSVALSVWFLPQPEWRNLFLAGDALVAGMFLVDPLVPGGWRLKRVTSPIRTFLFMNAAAFAAAAVFFVPAQKLWKPTRVAKR